MIIKSLLDTDLYKFTMAQVVLHRYPAAHVRYSFKCRNNIDLSSFAEEIRAEVYNLCTLQFTQEELEYLSTIPFIKPDFIEYLRLLKLNPDYVNVYSGDDGLFGEKKLCIDIEGPWISTIWFEVPILAIVSETWAKYHDVVEGGMNKLRKKVEFLSDSISNDISLDSFRFADFGTRRRYSFHWQREHVVPTLAARFKNKFVGTSNVLIAKELGLKPIGTMAHEFIMAHQQLGFRLKESQSVSLQAWADEYRGALGIALSDTVGMDAFLRDFDLYFAKLFDGARHDSGDPFTWGYKWAKHLKDLGVDPRTKSGVFSNSLTFELALKIHREFYGIFSPSFGIGTYLTHDMGMEPPNIVIKMVECNGSPVAKISDSPGKQMCEDDKYLNSLRRVYSIGG